MVTKPRNARATRCLSLALCIFLSMLNDPANAAIRKCLPAITATGTDPSNEIEARRQAMENWTRAARENGAEYTGWQLTTKRVLECSKESTGRITCTASAHPCTILQNPQRFDPSVPTPKVSPGKDI